MKKQTSYKNNREIFQEAIICMKLDKITERK